jgi:hypothetical protein
VELFIHSSVSQLVVSLLGGLGLDPEDCGGEGVGDDYRRRTETCVCIILSVICKDHVFYNFFHTS